MKQQQNSNGGGGDQPRRAKKSKSIARRDREGFVTYIDRRTAVGKIERWHYGDPVAALEHATDTRPVVTAFAEYWPVEPYLTAGANR